MADGDGRYEFEIGMGSAIVELYTVDGRLYYDLFVNGKVISKRGTAQSGEDHTVLLDRTKRVIRG